MLIYIIYTDKYTYLVRAKRGEKFTLSYVYYTTLYFVNISLNLFSSARSAEKKRVVLRTSTKHNFYCL